MKTVIKVVGPGAESFAQSAGGMAANRALRALQVITLSATVASGISKAGTALTE
jgi:hypothetical protein